MTYSKDETRFIKITKLFFINDLMEDTDILQLFNDGNREEAFSFIVRKYGERLYWLIRRMVVVHADADDCLQNTFLKAWKSFGSFRGESGIFTWLYRIAVNETISFLNARKPVEWDSYLAATLGGDPYFDGTAAQTLLQQAIAQLPPMQKAVFILRYFDDMPYKEMAQILDSSEGSLKASYHHAYGKISDYLKSHSSL